MSQTLDDKPINPMDAARFDRRAFVGAAAALAVTGWAPLLRAQIRTARVGVLIVNEAASKQPWHAPFVPGLAERGWVQGKNLVLEYRYARGADLQFEASARELVQLNVDVLYAVGAPPLRAAYAATRTIPIVASDFTSDPIAEGYVQSYGRPGKNITGVFLDAPEFAGKWLDLLKAIVPGLKRVAILFDPAMQPVHLRAVERTAKSSKVQFRVYEARSPRDFDNAFAAFRGWPQALVILPSPVTWTNSAQLAELTLKYRLPATSMARVFADAGGAITYGPDNRETSQRNAAQVARILGGAKVGDLPIERPTKFEFLLNMKTIKALGLKVPDTLLLGAEQVNQ